MKQKNKPKISVVMAVYNGKMFLAEAIESILKQTLEDFEFILINDFSKDSSLKIIKNYMKKDKRIILVNNPKNIGSALSRNIGLQKARGKYIAILDQDDIALPERLKTQSNFLNENKDIFLIGGGAIIINARGEILNKFKPLRCLNKIKNILPKKCIFYHPTIMFRNEKNLFYREKIFYADDYDFYLRLLSDNRKMENIPMPLIFYRIHELASSRKNSTEMKLFAEKSKEFYQQRLKFGKDNYEQFDPKEILSLKTKKTKRQSILESKIKTNFKTNDFKETKKLCKKYFKTYGYFNEIAVYYFVSFFSKKAITFIRKIVFG